MSYFESHQALGHHPKLHKLARLLGISRVTAVGHLNYLWWWALDYALSGDVTRFDAEEIAEGAQWEGDATAFVNALQRAGFLDRDEAGTAVLHDWEQYTGMLQARRAANADRQRAYRERAKLREQGNEETPTTSAPARNGHVTVTLPSRNGANVTELNIPNHTYGAISSDSESSLSPSAPPDDALPTGPLETPPGAAALTRRPARASENGHHAPSERSGLPPGTPVPAPPVADPLREPVAARRSTPRAQPVQGIPSTPHRALWDALVEAFGYTPETQTEATRWGKALRDLLHAGATPEEVLRRTQHHAEGQRLGVYRWTLTPMALASHWGEVAHPPLAPVRAQLVSVGAPGVGGTGPPPARSAEAARPRPFTRSEPSGGP